MSSVEEETDYTMVDGKKVPNCNVTTNNKEYYISDENAGKLIGGIALIPFLLSSIGATGLMAIIFGAVALGIRFGGKEKKTTGGVIALVVFFVLCLISMIGSIVSMRLNVKAIEESGENPCYSKKQKKIIEKQ